MYVSHQWPTPSEPVVTDPVTFEVKAVRAEVERRSCYFDKIDKTWSDTLIPIIKGCLDNVPKNRASIVDVCSQLEVLISDKHSSTDVIDLSLSTLQQEIEKKDAEICDKNAQIQKKNAEIEKKDAEISKQNAQIENKDIQIQHQANEIETLKADIAKVQDTAQLKVQTWLAR